MAEEEKEKFVEKVPEKEAEQLEKVAEEPEIVA